MLRGHVTSQELSEFRKEALDAVAPFPAVKTLPKQTVHLLYKGAGAPYTAKSMEAEVHARLHATIRGQRVATKFLHKLWYKFSVGNCRAQSWEIHGRIDFFHCKRGERGFRNGTLCLKFCVSDIHDRVFFVSLKSSALAQTLQYFRLLRNAAARDHAAANMRNHGAPMITSRCAKMGQAPPTLW
jgi:hypothetical protein